MRVIIIRKEWILMAILLMGIILGGQRWYFKVQHTSTLPTNDRVIIVDPGHGGIDGGAVSKNGVLESHINLEIAQRLRKLLEQSGAVVILTRDTDDGLHSDTGRIRDKKNEDLRNRKRIMDESEADVFVSIHLNSFSETKYYGAQTFYPQQPEKSKLLAESIQEELIRVIDNGNNRVPKVKNDIYLMQNCTIPMVLVECGFLSNPTEEQRLQDPKYQEKIAWSMYIGILRYFSEITE